MPSCISNHKVFIVVFQFFVLRDYARETLALRWRSWMTKYYMERYLKDQTFYKIQSQSIIDNPDQRIVDDLSSFTGTTLSFSLALFNAAVDLISFSNILYGIYPPLFVVLLVYSIGGTAVSIYLGKVNFFCFNLCNLQGAVKDDPSSIAISGTGDSELLAREKGGRFPLWTCTGSRKC